MPVSQIVAPCTGTVGGTFRGDVEHRRMLREPT